MSWSTRFVSLKLCDVFHFRFRFAFLKVFIFVQQNAWTLWLSNAIIPLNKFLLPKNDLVTNFLNLENETFENVSFSSQ